MVFGVLCSQHGTKGKALTRMGVMGNCNDVSLRIVADGMDTCHLTTTDMVDTQQFGVCGILSPSFLAVDVLHNALSQCDCRP